MRTLDATVSTLNLACGAIAVVGLLGRMPGLLSLGIVAGYAANILALIVAFGVLVLALLRLRSGEARTLLMRSWLGIVNGAAVLIAWSLLVWSGHLPAIGGAQ